MLAEPVRQWTAGPMHPATLLLRQLVLGREDLERAHARSLDVNLVDYRAMGVLLGQGPVTPGCLAVELGTTPSATSNIIERLERVGHVTREEDPGDRRRVLVRANPESAGRAMGTILPILSSVEQSIKAMDADAQAAVVEYLRVSVRALQDAIDALRDQESA